MSLIEFSKTLTATGNYGGQATWNVATTYPTLGATGQGYGGSITVNVDCYSFQITSDKEVRYFPRPTSATNWTNVTPTTNALDMGKVGMMLTVEGYLCDTDTSANTAGEKMFKLMAMQQQGGEVTLKWRGISFTQVQMDNIHFVDNFESTDATVGTPLGLDSTSAYSKTGEAKIQVVIKCRIAKTRGT